MINIIILYFNKFVHYNLNLITLTFSNHNEIYWLFNIKDLFTHCSLLIAYTYIHINNSKWTIVEISTKPFEFIEIISIAEMQGSSIRSAHFSHLNIILYYIIYTAREKIIITHFHKRAQSLREVLTTFRLLIKSQRTHARQFTTAAGINVLNNEFKGCREMFD